MLAPNPAASPLKYEMSLDTLGTVRMPDVNVKKVHLSWLLASVLPAAYFGQWPAFGKWLIFLNVGG